MKNKQLFMKILLPVLIVLLYALWSPFRFWVNDAASHLKSMDVESVKAYILSFGIWAPIVSFLLMVFQSIAAPLPAFLITFANAGLFGWIKGAILSWSSAMAGAVLCFFIAKWYGRSTVEKLTSKQAIENVDQFFGKYGKYAILIARLLPFISFDVVSYAAGLTSMNFWSFFWATGIGQLPATIVYSYVGGMLTGSVRMFVMGLLLLFSFTVIIAMIKKMSMDRKASQK